MKTEGVQAAQIVKNLPIVQELLCRYYERRDAKRPTVTIAEDVAVCSYAGWQLDNTRTC